ncbi:hypothetical protein GW17_00062038 [Ensete ventricosum]|nr:hypothetical protein GW17_00062038 [Ensete ventricosum]
MSNDSAVIPICRPSLGSAQRAPPSSCIVVLLPPATQPRRWRPLPNRVDSVHYRQQPPASTLPTLLPCNRCYLLPKSLYLATAFAIPCHRHCHVAAALFF